MKQILFRLFILLLLFVLFIVLVRITQRIKERRNNATGNTSATSIPYRYKDLYTSLESSLSQFEQAIDDNALFQQYPVVFGAELLVANGNRGTDLLSSHAIEGVKLSLDRMKKLGIQGVTVAIPYPLLTERNANYQEYIKFYKEVASEVKKRDMKLEVEAGVIFSGTGFSTLHSDYSTIPFNDMKKEIGDMDQLVINELSPNYLNLSSEPDTLANLIGRPELNSSTAYTAFINYLLTDLKRGTTLVGAGASTWLPSSYSGNLIRNTSLDFISLHIYPVTKSVIDTIFTTTKLARQYNKKLVIDEAWLYKARQNEVATHVAATEKIFKRDAYSFWQPLDKDFHELIMRLAQTQGIEYISPFWTNNYFAYIEYSDVIDNMSYKTVVQDVNKKAAEAMIKGKYSDLGLYYQQLIEQNQ